MENLDIRKSIRENDLKHWEVAEALGVSEGLFCRRLRRELPEEEKAKVYEAIKALEAMHKKNCESKPTTMACGRF